MTRAFIVHVVVPDDGSVTLQETADDISDDLVAAGHDVERVEVWSSPLELKTAAAPFLPPASQPPSLL